MYGCECVRLPLSLTFLYLCSYANFRAFVLGAILVHARHRGTTGVLNGSPQRILDCGLGYCWICGIWLLFRVEGGFFFLYCLDFGPWILINAIVDQEQVSRGYRRKGHSGGRSW